MDGAVTTMAGLLNRLYEILSGSQKGRVSVAGQNRAKRKLRMELLEGRQLMAANITGTVFQDLTDNGFNTGVDPNLSGVTIALFRDGGNTSYDSGTGTTAGGDDIAAGTATSATTTGLYSFSVNTAGTYFVVQTSVATGLIQRPTQRVQTVIVTSTDLAGVGLTTIDTFDTTAQSVSASFGGTTPAFNALAAAEAIGGERDVFVDATAGTISMQADTPSTTNYLAFDVGAGANGTRILTYDGADGDAQVLATNGLGGIDLTSAGTATGFRFLIGGEAGTQITIQVNSGANASTRTIAIPTTSGASPTATLDVPFADFTTSSGTGANFSSVGSVQFSVSGPNAADAIVDMIQTFGATTITRNIANLTPMSIGNLVFSDRNNNGTLDTAIPTETGVSGVTLQLFTDTNNNGVFNAGVDVATLNSSNLPISTTTDSSGNYTFTNLFPGRYFAIIPSSQFLTGGAAAGFVVSSTTPSGTNNNNKGVSVTGTGVVTSLISLNAGAAPTTDGDTNANTDLSFDIGIVPQFDLTVAKTTTATVAATGTTITYTITARNDGPSPASGVTLSDDVPDGLKIISATSSVVTDNITIPTSAGDNTAANPDNITVDVGTLASSTTTQRTITIVAEVLPVTTGTGTPAPIVNSVTIAGLGTELTALPNTASVSLPVQLRNDLTILKSIVTNPASTGTPAIAAPGTTITYTLTARNDNPTTGAGSSRATTVRVTDDIPDGIQVLTATLGSTALTIPTTASDNVASNPVDLVVNIPDLLVGTTNQQIITITAVVLGSTAGLFTNTATIASTSTTENADTNPNNNSASVQANAQRSIDLAVVKTITTNPASTATPATAAPGSTLTYTITASNNGPLDATTVRVVDNIPDGLQIISVVSSDNTDQITTPPTALDAIAANNDDIIVDVGSLAVGSSAATIITVIARVLPTTQGSFTNVATISATDTVTNVETITTNNSSSIAANSPRTVDLTILKSGPTTAVSGNTITYTMTATNNGPSDATSVQVVDNIPDGIRVISATVNGNTVTIPATASDGTASNPEDLTFPVGNLASGGSNTTIIIVAAILPASTGALVNSAVISTTDTLTTETPTNNNSASVTTTLTQQNDVGITKSGPTSSVAGGTITYSMNVTNNGPSTATLVNVVDTLPAGVVFVSGTSLIGTTTAGTVASGTGNTANVTIPTLAPGETAVVTIRATAPTTAPSNVTNTVTVTAANDSVSSNNTATAATAITAPAVANLSGRIYIDSNNDGTGQSTEPGVPNVTVTLAGTTTNGGATVNRTTTTDNNGDYTFTNVDQGTYAVTSAKPSDSSFRAANPGSTGGTAGTQQITGINLAGTNSVTNNVGFVRQFSKRLFLASGPTS
jgi:uncharacterized repeat protein (TIGR01451 family)